MWSSRDDAEQFRDLSVDDPSSASPSCLKPLSHLVLYFASEVNTAHAILLRDSGPGRRRSLRRGSAFRLRQYSSENVIPMSASEASADPGATISMVSPSRKIT